MNNSPLSRPRRNRKTESIRRMMQETQFQASNLVLPLFVQEGENKSTPIDSLPGHFRLSIDLIVKEAQAAFELGIKALCLFPVINPSLKNSNATESTNDKGLLPQTIRAIKSAVPEITIITDVAMDPYSSDGHDGVVKNGKIINDATLPILAQMALTQAKAGADIVAPSDMMDGRVAAIRKILDESNFQEVSILSYAAKYASSLYGPFRDALDSSPKDGDKKTYQMDPSNIREAKREIELDIAEGADILMVKPALHYLDVISTIKSNYPLPIAAYHVSGEYAMIKAASEKGWINGEDVLYETLVSIKRAGADIIFTYGALEIAERLKSLK